ncbi:MAG: hypothetical protein A3K65_09880 [Euryarchaeota archaeon RBG_16_68_12]|nr:MAG: hypothetical protein A3K65_09880 [Euryarchaeota archaeon RBG_16_68_12]
MTTIRLSPRQKAKLNEASRILQALRKRRVSHGEAVEALAEIALADRRLLARAAEGPSVREDDPFFDLSLVFDLGPTDERTHDRVLYGRK